LKKSSICLKNLKKISRLGTPGIVTGVFLAFTLIVIILYNSSVGLANDIGIQEPSMADVDISLAPPSVVADAEQMAAEVVGINAENYQKVVKELVGSYLDALSADIVIFFNSGGMGWNYVYQTPGWESILNGIVDEIETLGYHPLLLNYSRTSRDFWSNIKEVIEAATRYTKKVIGMEKRVQFLNDHLPNLQFIIAGESTGSVISEEAMKYFRDNPNVYTIQTGCPFWYKTTDQPRTLRIMSNGYGIDTFSYGNLPSMVWCTFKGWFGLESPEENAGNVLKSLRAPGHDYTWDYDAIRSDIVGFLETNFPKKN
jgi:hypothetical protein